MCNNSSQGYLIPQNVWYVLNFFAVLIIERRDFLYGYYYDKRYLKNKLNIFDKIVTVRHQLKFLSYFIAIIKPHHPHYQQYMLLVIIFTVQVFKLKDAIRHGPVQDPEWTLSKFAQKLIWKTLCNCSFCLKTKKQQLFLQLLRDELTFITML